MHTEKLEESCRYLLEQGTSYAEIQRILHISSKTISSIKKGTFLQKNHSCGRPSVIIDEMKAFIDSTWLGDARITDASMTKLVNSRFHTDISESTVCRCRQELKFEYRPPKVVQDLSPQQVEQRVEFCQWVLSHEQNFQNVIFSDESRFEKAPDNRWRRIKRGNVFSTAPDR